MLRFPPLTPFVKKLLIGLLGAFVIELLLQNWVGLPIFELLSLQTSHPGLHSAWQIFTHVLVLPPGPGSVISLMIGLLFLWWILSPFEDRFGAARTAQLCVVTAVSAAIPALAVGAFFAGMPSLSGSGPLLIGGIAAFAISLRNAMLSFFGLFMMRPIHLIFLVLGISLLMFLASGNVIELLADIGAVGGGVLFMKWIQRPRRPARRPKAKPSSKARNHGLKVIEGGGRGDDERPPWLN